MTIYMGIIYVGIPQTPPRERQKFEPITVYV